jgi:hypothetical protein
MANASGVAKNAVAIATMRKVSVIPGGKQLVLSPVQIIRGRVPNRVRVDALNFSKKRHFGADTDLYLIFFKSIGTDFSKDSGPHATVAGDGLAWLQIWRRGKDLIIGFARLAPKRAWSEGLVFTDSLPFHPCVGQRRDHGWAYVVLDDLVRWIRSQTKNP